MSLTGGNPHVDLLSEAFDVFDELRIPDSLLFALVLSGTWHGDTRIQSRQHARARVPYLCGKVARPAPVPEVEWEQR